MTINTLINQEEAKDFIYFLLGELDGQGWGMDHWYRKFLETRYARIVGERKRRRRCFGLFNSQLKLCRELCRFQTECEQKTTVGRLRKCTHCGRPAMLNKSMCEYHKRKVRAWETRTRESRFESGRCMSCGRFNDRKNTINTKGRRKGGPLRTCSICASKNRARNHLRYSRRFT